MHVELTAPCRQRILHVEESEIISEAISSIVTSFPRANSTNRRKPQSHLVALGRRWQMVAWQPGSASAWVAYRHRVTDVMWWKWTFGLRPSSPRERVLLWIVRTASSQALQRDVIMEMAGKPQNHQGFISVLGVAESTGLDSRAYRQLKFISHNSGDMKVWDEGAGRLGV